MSTGRTRERDGRYFRASVWGWHPLAEYLVEVAPDLMAKVTYLHSNERDGLDHEDSVALATALQQVLTSGHTAAYVQARDEAIAALPRLTCRFCEGTGMRSDEVGVRLGFTARNWCNGCDGCTDGSRLPFRGPDAPTPDYLFSARQDWTDGTWYCDFCDAPACAEGLPCTRCGIGTTTTGGTHA